MIVVITVTLVMTVKNKTSNEQQWSQYKSRNNTKIWKLTEMEVTTARKQVKIAMFL